ncbi:MAG: hypothetical protein JNK77_05210, partial [Saprospiraceae bacterium]|nr:hypothetical protein [Saprospiraceae bacterium]
QAPVITCPPTTNVPCGSSTDPSVTGNPTVSDNCTPTPQIMVAFSDQAAGDQILRTWTATDQVGNAASCVQTISFSDTQAPVITCPPTSNVPCGSSTDPSVTGNPTVSDNCTPTPQIMVAFSDQAAGDQIMRTWTATDQVGNAASCVQTISFSDTQAPVITCPANAVLPAGTPPTPNNTGNPTASDNCTPTPQIALAFSDQSSGTGCSQVIQRTWNATDLAGNTASCVQTISFSDTQAPVITCPANVILSCGASIDPSQTGLPAATDNCSSPTQITLTFTDQGGGTGCTQVIIRNWTAIDAAGNASNCTQQIQLIDLEPPVILCPPVANVTCGQQFDPTFTGIPVVSDECGNPVNTEFLDDLSDFNNCEGLIVRTWLGIDICGNASSCQQFIFVTLTLHDPPPSLIIPIISQSYLSIETAPEQIAVQLPENPGLVLFEQSGYTYNIPLGGSIGASWQFDRSLAISRWQLWGQWQTSSGQIDYSLANSAVSQPAFLSVPFTSVNSLLGLRLMGKQQRFTPFVGFVGQCQHLKLHNGAVRLGNRRFSATANAQNTYWMIYLETGLQVQAGKNSSIEMYIERVPSLLQFTTPNSLMNRLGMGFRLIITNNHNMLPPKAEFSD